MRILINNMPARIKSGSSFDLISENRLFTGSDSYTLNIEFPMKDCPENIAIFGFQNRTDSAQIDDVFDCEIVDGKFHKVGVVTVTERNETSVKTQFLEGRSALNYKSSFDNFYINEMLLEYPSRTRVVDYNGIPWDVYGSGGSIYDEDAISAIVEHEKFLALPWVNNNSGNVQNDVIPNYRGTLWRKSKNYSFMPYLTYLTELIAHYIDYDLDITEWKNSAYKDVIVCNCLPAAWELNSFARALPHWTLTEYFEKLEQFLKGEFEIDHKARTITFRFTSNVLAEIPSVELKDVLNDFSVEHTKEDESEYFYSSNVKYSDCGHRMWKYYSCKWLVDDMKRGAMQFPNFEELRNYCNQFRTFEHFRYPNTVNRLFYDSQEQTYYILKIISRQKCIEYVEEYDSRCLFYRYTTQLEQVNVFGEMKYSKDSSNEIVLDFVPAWIDDTDKGKCIFLESAEYDETNDITMQEEQNDSESLATKKTLTQNLLDEGEKDGKTEYYDKIYFAYWPHMILEENQYARPLIDSVTLYSNGWGYIRKGVSFRINETRNRNDVTYVAPIEIYPKEKYTFKFLADELPNVRSVFYIKGTNYLCKKLTATFTENGMSKLIKGEFYKVRKEDWEILPFD